MRCQQPKFIRPLRRGVAAVEMACLMPLLLALMLGVWEMGRYVQVQEIMNNAARAGARLASQATIYNTNGVYTNISVTGSSPCVYNTVSQYLQGSGLTNVNNLSVTFTFTSGNTSLTQPYQGVQNQQFQVTVSMPFSNVQWSSFGLINPSTVSATCVWQVMVDTPFTVSTTLPTWNPITNSN
jgi:Flp pilus assembly protein TadG